jgi:hypothetical protein
MGTFAETAIVDYRSSIADRGKQISVFCSIVDYRLYIADQGKQISVFCFRFAANKRKFAVPFSVCSKQTEVAFFPLPHITGHPVPEPKATRQGEKARILNKMYHVQAVLVCQSCSACPILPVLSACPVLFCLSRSAFLFGLSCSACPVLAVLTWHTCPGRLVLPALFCLSHVPF